MSRSAVIQILQQIDALPQRDRLLLERELATRSDKEWQSLAVEARIHARRREIDQEKIDRAVEQTRYGRK